VAAAERLQLRLLIGTDDVLVRAQLAALEHPGVEIQDAAGLLREGRVARGRSTKRVCHGLIASSCSQRQIVDADASVTPRSITNRCSSVHEKRPNGRPCVAGNSQAIAFTSATCSAPSPVPPDTSGRVY
jgi:hypothetical protein